jgi:putative transposase
MITFSGELIIQLQRRGVKLRSFLDTSGQNVPPQLDIHLISDGYGMHRRQLIRDWLAMRLRFCLHFPPASANWLSLVE